MNLNNIMLLKKNIIKIENYDKNSKELLETWENDRLALFSINKNVHKYSNTKVPLYRFFLNKNSVDNFTEFEENIITKNNHYNITYKCIKCDSIHKVALNNILRKINNNITNCKICKEYEELKRINQSIKLKTHYYNIKNNINQNIIHEDKIEIMLLDKLTISGFLISGSICIRFCIISSTLSYGILRRVELCLSLFRISCFSSSDCKYF